MKALRNGFQRAADLYDLQIIGGDTISNCKLDIAVTIVSETTVPLLRKGLKHGDLLAHTGVIGRARRELRYLLAGARVHQGSKFVSFSLRSGFVKDATASLHCGMDISDGLFSDLEKLGRLNGVGYRFFQPVSAQTGCSGEEYEMLVGFAPRQRKKILRLAQKNRTRLNIVGRAVRGKFRNRCKAHHFR
jgi:thiamine-monophosphate kinase